MKFKYYYYLITTSFDLDIKFIKLNFIPLSQKLNFILKKYFIIFIHIFKPFVFGKSYIEIFKRKIYYENKYGLAGMQRIFCCQAKSLKLLTDLKDPVIFDIGANVGHFSLIMNMIFKNSLLYSFEPIVETFSILKANTKALSNINILNFGISDHEHNAFMNFDKNKSYLSHIDDHGTQSVKLLMLDEFCFKNKIEKIDILKIDAEGHELKILNGCNHILSLVKYLWLEVTIKDNNNFENNDYTFSQIFSKLFNDKYNFQILYYRNFSNQSEGELVALDVLMKNIVYSEKYDNK